MDNELRHRLAIVDCGTNTFTMHVARFEGREWKSLFRQRRFVRLGHDSFRTGRISPDRFRRGLDVLSSFRETARNYGVTHVRAIGCSALRDASNGPDFVKAARQLGWDVNVIAGDQEAHWIQLGVADTVPPVGMRAAWASNVASLLASSRAARSEPVKGADAWRPPLFRLSVMVEEA